MGKSVTALRIENFATAVTGRKQRLKEALKVYGKALELDHRDTLEFWGELRRLTVMPNRQTLLWRISTKPTTAPKLVAAIKRYMPAEAYYDWAGGLIWLEVPATADAGTAEIRRATADPRRARDLDPRRARRARLRRGVPALEPGRSSA